MNPPKIIKPTLTTPTLDLNYFKNNPVRIKNPNPDTLNLIKDYYVCGYNSNTKKIFWPEIS